MKKILLSTLVGLFAISCTAGNNDAVKKSLTNINEELVVIQKSLTDTQMNMEDVQSASGNLQNDVSTNADAIAELRSEIAYLNNEILVLKGNKGATASAATQDLSGKNVSSTTTSKGNSAPLNNIIVLDETPSKQEKAQAAPQIVVIEDSGAAKNSLYSYAIELNRQRKYAEARGKFQEFIKKYPNDQLAGNAQYWIGETYYSVNDMKNAMKSFQDVLSKFPKSNKIPDAMLKIGYVQEKQGKKQDAIATFQDLLKKYPKSKPATLAKQKLQTLGA